MKKRKIVALVCVATVLLLAASAFWYVQTKLDKINKVPDTVDVIPPDQEDFETDTSNEPKDIINSLIKSSISSVVNPNGQHSPSFGMMCLLTTVLYLIYVDSFTVHFFVCSHSRQ